LIVNLIRAPDIRGIEIGGKTVEELFPRAAPKPHIEIFDLLEDPYEKNNLVNSPDGDALSAKLMKSLTEWQSEYGDPMADRNYLLEVIRRHAGLEKHFTGTMPEAR
jgi:hypothetical protein